MKLGTQTASMTNHIMSRAVIGQPEPTVGMGATILCWTDRHAATIVEVFFAGKGKSGPHLYVKVQEDKATRTDQNGMSEMQRYEYAPNPQGRIYTFRREKNGAWTPVVFSEKAKRWCKVEGEGLRIGERAKYHDFSF